MEVKRSLAADSAGFWQAVGASMCAGPLLSVALFGGIIAGIGGSAGPFTLVVITVGTSCPRPWARRSGSQARRYRRLSS